MQKMSLTALARDQLDRASSSSSGRSAKTVWGGHERVLRQTLIALTAGSALSEHENPGEATIQVVNGRVRLEADGVPAGGRVVLRTGPIDGGGAGTPPMRFAGQWRASAVDATVTVPAGSFARAEVLDSAGVVVGVGNPCWLPRA